MAARATSSVFLNVHNLEKSIEFYQALGFEVANETKDDEGKRAYVDLTYQGAELSLGQILGDADEEYTRWVSNELGAGIILYFTVPDVETIYNNAQDARATIEVPLRDRGYGRAFNLNDPDGYVVTFLQEKDTAKTPSRKTAPAAKARAAKPKAAAATKKKSSAARKPAGAAKKKR